MRHRQIDVWGETVSILAEEVVWILADEVVWGGAMPLPKNCRIFHMEIVRFGGLRSSVVS